jgi:hypothetical protein
VQQPHLLSGISLSHDGLQLALEGLGGGPLRGRVLLSRAKPGPGGAELGLRRLQCLAAAAEPVLRILLRLPSPGQLLLQRLL